MTIAKERKILRFRELAELNPTKRGLNSTLPYIAERLFLALLESRQTPLNCRPMKQRITARTFNRWFSFMPVSIASSRLFSHMTTYASYKTGMLTLITVLGASSCKEQPVEQQPGYRFGVAEGRVSGYEEGRDAMKTEMCKKIREFDDNFHSKLQNRRICD